MSAAHAHRKEQSTAQPDRPQGEKLHVAMARATSPVLRNAHLPPDDKKLDRTQDEVQELYKNPTTGRNTRLGRKVEKPQDPKAGGPSGQKDNAKHNKRHTNK